MQIKKAQTRATFGKVGLVWASQSRAVKPRKALRHFNCYNF